MSDAAGPLARLACLVAFFAQSLNGQVQVQTRQRPEGEDFSLNTAVAMNVNGDRVCIYADDKPDNEFMK